MKGWEVQDVLGTKQIDGVTHYRIQWLGWAPSYNSWEPAGHLSEGTLNYYHSKIKQEQERKEQRNAMRQQAQEKKKKGRGRPSGAVSGKVEVLGHFYKGKDLWFDVRLNTRNTVEMERGELASRYGSALVGYYIQLAKQKGVY